MQNGKAPGPDGFNVDFFKACWNIVKQDILNVVDDSRMNRTILKIISKVVANRLKPLLPTLVSVEQSGYVEGRQILNNIIQAHEVVHSLLSNRKAGMIMQLDLAKTYDKLNWTYIKKVLIAFGFDHNWVRWVMALVTSSSFSILVNGSPSKTFSPSRGLRQGDPLSPFFFILMMEGLGRTIKQAKEVGNIKGLQLSENGQALTHQQFVDDTMLQGIPTVKEALAYKQILCDFAMATEFWASSKYLGFPLTDKPLHKSIWEPVINKMQDKIKKWTIRSLNFSGQLVLTKAVLQSIPVFMLSALLAPKGVLQQFRTIQRDFLWGKGEERNKWALVAWDKICKPKNHGGLGLDDPKVLSKVLGAKLWWCWVKYPKAQWASIWKEKYTSTWEDNDHIRMSGIIKGSHIWNKSWKNRGLIQENSFWEIREGDLALFWEDKWKQ
eukprot:PITA_04208